MNDHRTARRTAHLQRPREIHAWLQTGPTLAELRERFPREWKRVERELADVTARGDIEELKAHVLTMHASAPPGRAQRRSTQSEQLSALIRRQMTAAVLRQISLSAATGVTEGRVRFNLLNGWMAQKLLFSSDLERKPVSLLWFRILWPLLSQRRLLMPLVQPKGIYCFYSRPLIRELITLIDGRDCLEIAAGDGTLTRFLTRGGAQVTATDDHSWQHSVSFPASVARQDARLALRAHEPEVVLCSWPPADNTFERHVFQTATVQLYVVIASQHRFASGDWPAYGQQTEFTMTHDPALSRLVLPPELEAAVYVFRRRQRDEATSRVDDGR